ncbi:MAG: N-acetyltransferase family protein [Bacteroidota bacterium]
MIKVELAQSDDFEMLSDLGRRAFQEAFGQFNDPGDMQAYLDLSFDPQRIKSQLRDPEVLYLMAFYQGTAVGYAKLIRNSKTANAMQDFKQMQMERIYALGAYVGKKIGKSLMLESLRIAKAEGFDYMWLGVWQENQRAIKFYKDFGFEIIGVKQFVIGNEVNDDYVMGLKLT